MYTYKQNNCIHNNYVGMFFFNLKLTGLLYRRFHHCNLELMLRLYKAFIRPHFEYAPQVWDPYLVKDIEVLEKSQKFALQVCTRNWSATYPELLSSTQVSTLSDRRKIAKLCHLYKLVYDLTDCQNAPVVQRPSNYGDVEILSNCNKWAPTPHSFTPLFTPTPSLFGIDCLSIMTL